MNNLIFWYTGIAVWAVIAIVVALTVLLAAFIAAGRSYFGVRRYIQVWTICHAIGIKNDPKVVQQIRFACARLAGEMNGAPGLHTKQYSSNDVLILLRALDKYPLTEEEK